MTVKDYIEKTKRFLRKDGLYSDAYHDDDILFWVNAGRRFVYSRLRDINPNIFIARMEQSTSDSYIELDDTVVDKVFDVRRKLSSGKTVPLYQVKYYLDAEYTGTPTKWSWAGGKYIRFDKIPSTTMTFVIYYAPKLTDLDLSNINATIDEPIDWSDAVCSYAAMRLRELEGLDARSMQSLFADYMAQLEREVASRTIYRFEINLDKYWRGG